MDLVSQLEPSMVVLLERIDHRMAAADRRRMLRSADPASLTRDELIEQLHVAEEERARLAAREADLLVALAGRRPRERRVTVTDLEGNPGRTITVVDEALDLVAAAMGSGLHAVRRRVATARALHVRLPRTRARLAAGTISPEHAEVIARTSDGLPASALPVFETRVLRNAAGRTPHQTAAFARRLRARLDRAGEKRRGERARRHVDVQAWAEDDGLACVLARLPLADAARVEAALNARAQCVTWIRDDATLGERRAAALVEAVCGGPTDTGAGGGVEVQVIVDLETLLGVSDEPANGSVGSDSAVPMTSSALRALLSDPAVPVSLRRLVTDPLTGDLLDRGRTAYRVPEALRDFLVARDGTCRFPGCSRRAIRCDIDHRTPWSDGGRTDRDNLTCLCRRHHVLKTHGGWELMAVNDDGTVVWKGPDGGQYLGRPSARWDVSRADADDPEPPSEASGADPPF